MAGEDGYRVTLYQLREAPRLVRQAKLGEGGTE
jgi:hypothetical protein